MKKFNAFILCLLLLITCALTGCAGFEVNRVKYYNETVATVGDTHITRYELLSAYNSYGNNYYVNQQGKTEKEAMSETLNLLMDRESLYQYSHGKTEYKPTPYQVNTAIEELFDSMDSSMKEYVKQAKRILNVKVEDSTEDSKSDTAYKYSDYSTVLKGKRAELKTKTVYYTDDTKVTVSTEPTDFAETVDYIVYVEQEEPSFDCVLGANRMSTLSDFEAESTLDLVISTYFDRFNTSLENEEKQTEIYNKVIALLSQDLIEGEKYLRDENGKAYNTVTKDLIKRYFRKAYNDKIKSLYLTNVRTNYLKNASGELSITALLDKYVSLVRTGYNKYANNIKNGYIPAMKDSSTKADDIWYHPILNDGENGKADTKFGYFIHTLIKFSDEQTTAIKNLDKAKSIYNLSDEQYRAQYDAIIAKTTATARNASTGLIDKDAEKISLSEILSEYNTISSMDEFVTFMFKYTGDTATLSQGMPYVVGTNGNSAMETAFTDEAVRLMTNGRPGDMTSSTTNTDSKNGDVMCITSYGIHLLYYVGEVDMFDIPYGEIESAYIATSNRQRITYYTDATKTVVTTDKTDYYTVTYNNNNLYKMEINPLTHQTYFDKLFDLVYPASSSTEVYATSTGYTAKENELIAVMRKTNPAKIYKTKLDSTKTSL